MVGSDGVYPLRLGIVDGSEMLAWSQCHVVLSFFLRWDFYTFEGDGREILSKDLGRQREVTCGRRMLFFLTR